jgi:chromate transport protein ChrA
MNKNSNFIARTFGFTIVGAVIFCLLTIFALDFWFGIFTIAFISLIYGVLPGFIVLLTFSFILLKLLKREHIIRLVKVLAFIFIFSATISILHAFYEDIPKKMALGFNLKVFLSFLFSLVLNLHFNVLLADAK